MQYTIYQFMRKLNNRCIAYVSQILNYHNVCYNNRFATLACRIFTLVGTGGPAPWRWPFPDR